MGNALGNTMGCKVMLGLTLAVAASGCAMIRDRTLTAQSRVLTQERFISIPDENPCLLSDAVHPPVLTNMTLAACVELALTNNRALKRAASELERARLEQRVAAATVFEPKLTASYSALDDTAGGRLSAGYDSWLGFRIEPFLDLDYDADDELPRTTEAGISLSRRIFNGAEHIRLGLPTLRAQRDLVVAGNTLNRERRELRFNVARAFLALQRAVVRREVRVNRLEDAKAFLKATRERVEHGFTAPIDEVNARINLNQAEIDLLREETRLTNARENLLAILALDIEGRLDIVPEDVEEGAAAAPGAPAEAAADLRRLLQCHEPLVNQRIDIDLAEKEIRVQRDLLRPQLGLGLTARSKWEGDAFFETVSDDENFSVDLTYETALDGKRRDRARLAQMERRQYERLSSLRDAEDALETRFRALLRKIQELRSSIELAAERVKTEQHKLTATLRRYETGTVDNLEVTRAKQDLVDAEIQLLDSRIDLYLQRAEYESLLPSSESASAKAAQ